jgi:polysaccharide pyruvyl transferase WcaK-like protein
LKILIDNSGYELKNHGDLAMLSVAAHRFRKNFPNSKIYIFTDAPIRLVQLIPFAIPMPVAGRRQWDLKWNVIGSLHKLFPKLMLTWLEEQEVSFKLKYPILSRRWIEKRLSKRGYDTHSMQSYLNLIEQVDMVVATGGGYITDSFAEHASALLRTLALAQYYGKPTALFGQGLGPVKNKKLLKLAKHILPKLHLLTLREVIFSKPFALSVGVPENLIFVTGDDAITLAYSKKMQENRNAIGVNLRIASYSGIHEGILNDIRATFKLAQDKFGTQLIPIPISVHDGDSDIEAIRRLLPRCTVQSMVGLDTPEKVVEQVSRCRIVITGSYHAAVFALSQGISVVAIVGSEYYRHKFEGLANQFENGCIIIKQENVNFAKDLKSAIRLTWEMAEHNRAKLLSLAELQVSQSEIAYDKFIVSIKNHVNTETK